MHRRSSDIPGDSVGGLRAPPGVLEMNSIETASNKQQTTYQPTQEQGQATKQPSN